MGGGGWGGVQKDEFLLPLQHAWHPATNEPHSELLQLALVQLFVLATEQGSSLVAEHVLLCSLEVAECPGP
jgi:hypothetical protein